MAATAFLSPPAHQSQSCFKSSSPQSPLVVIEDGIPHINMRLDSRQYKTVEFAASLLHIIQSLRIRSWSTSDLRPSALKIHKVSGSLTNDVFFVSYTGARTLLLRVYGRSSSSLISRPHELHILHSLSSKYGIGPQVFGTFGNGRIEEYFDSTALSPEEMRIPCLSAWIAKRMAEMHGVDMASIIGNDKWELGVKENVKKWLPPAKEVLAMVPEKTKKSLGLDLGRFERAWEGYMRRVREWEKENGESPRVFAHNDAQYLNLLLLRRAPMNRPAHHQIIVVDFEYAAPNAAGFDIANHFHEWTTDYQSGQPHLMRSDRYPNEAERRNFYEAYLGGEAGIELLEREVKVWSAASHGMWAVWSIVQAREEVISGVVGEFSYLLYAKERLSLFYSSCC